MGAGRGGAERLGDPMTRRRLSIAASVAVLAAWCLPVTDAHTQAAGYGQRQLTFADHNHLLTNTAVWSHDGVWIYYDVRSDLAGSTFDGQRIERVHVATGRVEVVYQSSDGAHCGVVTANPVDDRIVFIHGPQRPTEAWTYGASRRRGVVVDPRTGSAANLDARDLVPPFTPGALRGGTHVHVYSGDGRWVSFTYEDQVLEATDDREAQANQRNVGVATPDGPVVVPKNHPRNHDGQAFSVVVTQTVDEPAPGSDEISRAYSDAWIGANGYVRADGSRQQRALAFIGNVVSTRGEVVPELFVVDLPESVTTPGEQPLCGTAATRPAPPRGARQRRLTHTVDRKFPGLGDVRHWPRSAPDGSRIAFLMRDDAGRTQLWTITPAGEELKQLTRNDFPIESAFSWRPDGKALACRAGGRLCQVDASSGETRPILGDATEDAPPRPEAVVYSPDGNSIALMRTVQSATGRYNQIFVVEAHQDR